MAYLLDTNVILRHARKGDSQHVLIVAAIDELYQRGELISIAPQSLAEVYVTATRPTENNGFGLTPVEGAEMVREMIAAFSLLPDHPDTISLWLEQVEAFGVSGVQSHDCRLVAFMRAHGVTNLLTLNGKDFQRYAPLGIVVTAPADVIQP